MAAIYGDATAVAKDLTTMFEETVQQVRPSLVPRLCTITKSDGAYEKYPFPSALAMPRKFGDGVVPTGVDVNATYQLDNETYELTLDFRRELLDDSRAFKFETMIRQVAVSGALYPDYLLSALIGSGATAGNNSYDGNTFYSDTHNFGKLGSNNIDNKLAGSGVSVTALRADLESAMAALRKFKDNVGRLANPEPAIDDEDLFVVQCPAEMECDFRQVCNSLWLPGASGKNKSIGTVVADGYLSDANDWYLHYTGLPVKPFVFQERDPLAIYLLAQGSEHCTNTGNVRIVLKHRFKIGYLAFFRSILTTN